MKQKTPAAPISSMLIWETREAFVRSQIQNTMQAMLEEELSTFLGRGKSERRAGIDPQSGWCVGRGHGTWRSASRAGCCHCSPGRAAT